MFTTASVKLAHQREHETTHDLGAAVFSFLHQTASSAQQALQRPTSRFASVSQTFLAASSEASEQVPEPKTGVLYPGEYCHRGKQNCPSLTGIGVRSKKIAGIKTLHVYTVGVYSDQGALKQALAPKYSKLDAAAIPKTQGVYDDFMTSNQVEKTLRLVIVYGGLRMKTFLGALNDRLGPVMTKAGEEVALGQFSSMLTGVPLQRGSTFNFTATRQGTLLANVDGTPVGSIASPKLCQALFDIYLGPDSVSPDAKQQFGAKVASIIKG